MTDFGKRPLLPQDPFVSTSIVPERREKQTNYVFVDEHNRSRRLKVMRACESCRKRKIKCDAASTNVWPCGACLKQKIPCAPPPLSGDTDSSGDFIAPEESSLKPTTAQSRSEVDLQYDFFTPQQHIPNTSNAPSMGSSSVLSAEVPTSSDMSAVQYPSNFNFRYRSMDASLSQGNSEKFFIPQNSAEPLSQLSPTQSNERNSQWGSENAEKDLAKALGDLKISANAAAPYITNQRNLADSAAMQEAEAELSLPLSPDSKVSIPPEMMPSEKQAQLYFEYFFKNIHPYVPVLNPTAFNQQWHVDKQSISPLILEAIFACSAQLLHQSAEAGRWLALAARHEDSFGDVPRLSTIQGLLLLLKAREAVPKRGYYFRSWMHVVKLIAMAKDLDLDQHSELHQSGGLCDSTNLIECNVKTRVWQTLFIVEMMIGGAQGRMDYSIPFETIYHDYPTLASGLDETEIQVSRNYSEFVTLVKFMRHSSAMWARWAKQRNKASSATYTWAVDHDFVQHNQDFDIWLRGCAPALRIHFPADHSTPTISSHFVANLHCYYYLSILMHHRPQLEFATNSGDGSWKQQLLICYSAATRLCRLQEAVLQSYGIDGLLWMQRGVNFAIYCVLTSTLLHLVALTSPDPALNYDATDYFSRHMRILERCASAWPMPHMEAQIESLRVAFSADTTKPFELRHDFPYSSPDRSAQSSPPSDSGLFSPGNDYLHSTMPSYQVPYQERNHSAGSSDGTIAGMQPAFMGQSQGIPEDVARGSQGNMQTSWNPSKIFDQWNMAFIAPPPASEEPSPPPQTRSVPNVNFNPQFAQNVTNVTNVQYNNNFVQGSTPQFPQVPYPLTQAYSTPKPVQDPTMPVPQMMPQMMPQTRGSFGPTMQPSVTPSMWQDVVANSYISGSKRRWNDGVVDQSNAYKRTR